MNKTEMVSSENALPGGHTPVLAMPFFHRVTGDRLDRPFPSSETVSYTHLTLPTTPYV